MAASVFRVNTLPSLGRIWTIWDQNPSCVELKICVQFHFLHTKSDILLIVGVNSWSACLQDLAERLCSWSLNFLFYYLLLLRRSLIGIMADMFRLFTELCVCMFSPPTLLELPLPVMWLTSLHCHWAFVVRMASIVSSSLPALLAQTA